MNGPSSQLDYLYRRSTRLTPQWLIPCVLLLFLAAATDAAPIPAISKLQELTVANLVSQLDTVSRFGHTTADSEQPSYGAILSELVRRGGKEAEDLLKTRLRENAALLPAARDALRKMENRGDDEWRKQHMRVDQLENNLELLTALRRIQNQKDPLKVVITLAPDVKAGTRKLPVLHAALKNADVERESVWLAKGGDYRSGRLARWRIDVWNAKGARLSVRENFSVVLGGMFTEGALAPGETWETDLPVSDYVDIRQPGKYKLQVSYHNTVSIADIKKLDELDHLIVFKSEPMTLDVEKGPKIIIHLKPGSTETARELVTKLDEDSELRIVVGTYNADFYDFLDPESPAGKLLSLDSQAVPALLDLLAEGQLSPRKQAWVFSLLYSITAERDLDPMKAKGVLPSYTWKRTPGNGGSIRFPTGGRTFNGQAAFAKKWQAFKRDYIEVHAVK